MTSADDDELFESALARAAERAPWRSLSELLDDDEVRRVVTAEFPEGAETPPSHITRRGFMKLLGASVALASVGAAGCQDERRRLLPYVEQPDDAVPGVSSFYATALSVGPFASGLVVESREGRPVKIEGNPLHPANLGASSVFEQASLLQLYDPSRARRIRSGALPSTWRAFFESVVAPARAKAGRGLCFLLEPTSSPLVTSLLERIGHSLPAARVFFHAPLHDDAAASAAEILYQRPLTTLFDFTRARRVLSLDDNFLAEGPFALRYARQFAAARRPIAGAEDRVSRLYVVEATHSVTGAMADGRLAVKRAHVGDIGARVLLEVSRLLGPARGAMPSDTVASLEAMPKSAHDPWARAVARDLVAHAGESAVVVGRGQPKEAHVIGALLNHALGNVGSAVWLRESASKGADTTQGLAELRAAVAQGDVDTLIVLEGNPAYTAPADLDVAALFARVETTGCLSLFEHETAALCDWFLPALHPLEMWGDGRAYDGTVAFTQPLVRPLYGGHTATEVLAAFLGQAEPSARELLQERWRGPAAGGNFDVWWNDVLRKGILPGSASPRAFAEPDVARATRALDVMISRSSNRSEDEGLELAFYDDARVYDGRFANNAWLLELPEPMTKLTWDNAALLSPRTAARLGLEDEHVITLRKEGRSVRAPVLILPGHADDSISVHLGFGRAGHEVLATGVGFNAYALRTSAHPWFTSGLVVEETGERHALARTQGHWDLLGRPIVKETTVAELQRPTRAVHEEEPVESLYHVTPQAEQQWGMAIDLNVCTGCSSCVVACQAENNIPVVGKEGVLLSREMHWLRIDRYFMGRPESPDVVMQPMLCQHCERAPCEYVCPVNATVHSADGLNEMIYNRCVGTRFCSNNCPYKVRRFNYFDYHRSQPETLAMAMNPEVTVRARGVMEKCTFCVQRIRKGQRNARLDGRALADDEVKTACQQACPTEAIVFGLVSRAETRVSELSHDRRAYSVLHELGTLPRVRYLAKVRHPNEELGER